MNDGGPDSATAAKRVCAIVVTYHPDAGFARRALVASCAQVGALVIVDNGSGEAAIKMLRGLAANPRSPSS